MRGALMWIARDESMIRTFWNSTGRSATQFLLGIIGLALITLAAVRL
jgi:hypothetical protein